MVQPFNGSPFLRLSEKRGIAMSFTEEQDAFRDSVRKMVAKHVAPIAAEVDANDRFPTELVKLFGEMGLMQLWVPEAYGGPNGNLTMMCIAREEISKVSPACASIAGRRDLGDFLAGDAHHRGNLQGLAGLRFDRRRDL